MQEPQWKNFEPDVDVILVYIQNWEAAIGMPRTMYSNNVVDNVVENDVDNDVDNNNIQEKLGDSS